MKVNYHTHTTRCKHAKGTEREYVEAAIKNGLNTLGFADHTPYPFPDNNYILDVRMSMHQIEDYINTVLSLREEYRRDIKIHLGLEVEYYPKFFHLLLEETSQYPIEYFLLAQHSLGNGEACEKHSYSITNDAKRLERYCEQLKEGMDTGCFTYLAHPDMISFIGDPQLYNAQMHSLCRHAKVAGLPLEINFLGLRENRRYPNEMFWEIAGEEGCDVIFGLDAHDTEAFQIADLVKKAEAIVERYHLHLLNDVTLINPYKK